MVWVGVALVLVAIEAATVDFIVPHVRRGRRRRRRRGGLRRRLPSSRSIVAVLVAVALLAIVRPWLKNRIQASSRPQLMGAAAHVGRSAVAMTGSTRHGGRVKLAGETWSARTLGDDHRARRGGRRRPIDGATAIVSRARVVGELSRSPAPTAQPTPPTDERVDRPARTNRASSGEHGPTQGEGREGRGPGRHRSAAHRRRGVVIVLAHGADRAAADRADRRAPRPLHTHARRRACTSSSRSSTRCAPTSTCASRSSPSRRSP